MTEQQKSIMDEIRIDMKLSQKQVQFKRDVQDAKHWLQDQLRLGLIPSCLHDPRILSHLGDDADLHSIAATAHALVEIDYEDKESIENDCYA